MSIPLPADLLKRYSTTAERRAWLQRLPTLIHDACERWDLRPDLQPGAVPWNGFAAIALPVRQADGSPAVLKISFPYEDIAHEPDALQLWSGQGAVRLLDHDAASSAMLLERLDAARWLQAAPLPEAIAVWGSLVSTLSIAEDGRPQWRVIPSLADRAERWSDDFPAEWSRLAEPCPRWLLEAALEVCQTRGAVGRRQSRDVLVHADLHGMNILARPGSTGWQASDFLAIDPQAVVGDAEFAVTPMLNNRLADLPERNPELALLERLQALCSAAGLDQEVARQWSIAREMENILWYAAKPGHRKDLQRSLWISSTLAGRTLEGLPHPHQLDMG
ncbi:aminoglycoside phosphotransferase family protein [Psychromicrobium xiongbiense]|uniref:aminoglycoside phosphotransferase family protein n=1 Tax=Psychromicrobium xiongbiense TaxID=3051184 RepID=UPI002553019B|nr:aminoglycoside phosphotransferase family protein [Psychromicrobium sp. YIM S02556]